MSEPKSSAKAGIRLGEGSGLRTVSRYLLGATFVVAGANHFLHESTYVRTMPTYIPRPEFMVELSGVAEIALGAALFVPPLRRPAAWGLVALLIAVFPANVQMALHPGTFPTIPRCLLWARLPFQAVFIAWAWWHTRAD